MLLFIILFLLARTLIEVVKTSVDVPKTEGNGRIISLRDRRISSRA